MNHAIGPLAVSRIGGELRQNPCREEIAIDHALPRPRAADIAPSGSNRRKSCRSNAPTGSARPARAADGCRTPVSEIGLRETITSIAAIARDLDRQMIERLPVIFASPLFCFRSRVSSANAIRWTLFRSEQEFQDVEAADLVAPIRRIGHPVRQEQDIAHQPSPAGNMRTDHVCDPKRQLFPNLDLEPVARVLWIDLARRLPGAARLAYISGTPLKTPVLLERSRTGPCL